MIADVIDNDSWRIWPQGREELMLDKQMYRNLPEVDDERLERVKAAYETVAEMVGTFPVMRPGMVAVIADGERQLPARHGDWARRCNASACRPCATSPVERDARLRAATSGSSSKRRSRG